MKNWKRYLSIALTLVMLVGVLPTAAFADGELTISFKGTEPITFTYDGNKKEPEVTVVGADSYELTYQKKNSGDEGYSTVKSAIDAGDYRIYATSEGKTSNFLTFTINQAEWPIKEADVSVAATHEYDNTAPTVTVSGRTEGKEYTVTYKKGDETLSAAPVDVGSYSVIVAPTANYTGEAITKSYTITAKAWGADAIQVIGADSEDKITYSGSKPEIKVMAGSAVVPDGQYTLTYKKGDQTLSAAPSDVGSYTVTASPTANYEGAPVSKSFTIVAKTVTTPTIADITAQTYTGNAITPELTVKDGETTLTKDTDYTVVYSNNTNVGTASAEVTFKGNYTGAPVTKTFTITKAEITNDSVITTYGFCHASDTPSVTVTVGGRTLTAGTDYEVTKSDSGTTRTITVTGKGNYTGTGTKTQTILPDAAPTISGVESGKTYNTKPTVTVTGDNLVKVFVKQGTSSTETEHTATTADGKTQATFELDFAASAYTIRAVDKAGKSYTLVTNVTVSRKPITFSMVTVTGVDDITYDGTAKTATSIVVKDGEKTLELGTESVPKDYTVSYTNNTNAGTATITITGTGNYMGTVDKTFTIKRKPLTSAALSGIVDKTYTGSPIEQEGLTVKDGEKTLEKGSTKDYTVSYSNNTNPGTAKVTVTMGGNYSGVLEKTFTISQDLSTLIDNIKALAGDSDLSYDEKQQIKQLKAAYDALSATDKATVDSGVGSTLMTSFKNKASAAKFKLLNLPSLGYYRYTKGTSSNVVIKIDAEFGRTLVTEIRMGSNLTVIDPDDYEVKEGSVEVTLKSSFLKTIKTTGKYNLYIDLLDTETGHTETVQTVVRILPATDIVQTGDPFKMNLWIGLLGASVLALAGLGAYEVVKKKKNAQKRLEAAMNLDEEPSGEANTNE